MSAPVRWRSVCWSASRWDGAARPACLGSDCACGLGEQLRPAIFSCLVQLWDDKLHCDTHVGPAFALEGGGGRAQRMAGLYLCKNIPVLVMMDASALPGPCN